MAARKFASKPEQVRVGHRMYKVLWLLEEEYKAAGHDVGNRGHSDHASQEIVVLLELDGVEVAKDSLQEVLLHEVLHCCTNVSMTWNSWDLFHSKEWETMDEVMVGTTAPIFLAVMRDNPDMMKWLLS